jgi:hypothetical protein
MDLMKWAGRIALASGWLTAPLFAADDVKWQPVAPSIAMNPNQLIFVGSPPPRPTALSGNKPVSGSLPPPDRTRQASGPWSSSDDAAMTWQPLDVTAPPQSTSRLPGPIPLPTVELPAIPAVPPPPSDSYQWKPIPVARAPGQLIVSPEPIRINENVVTQPTAPLPQPKPTSTAPKAQPPEAKPKPKVEPISPPRPVLPTSPEPLPRPTRMPSAEQSFMLTPGNAVWGAQPSDPTGTQPAKGLMMMPLSEHHHPRVFGSPDLALSRDYPLVDFFGFGLFQDTNSVVLNEGPATDRSFVEAEYLLWWMRTGSIPSLATTSSNGGFGFLGQPDTVRLLGPGQYGDSLRSGFRVRAGRWFGEDCITNPWGVDGSYFFLGKQSDSFAANSGQFPVLTRPFFAPNINREFGEQVAFPGVATGQLNIDTTSELWGADINLRRALCRTCTSQSEWFMGYRHLNLRESLGFLESITSLGMLNDPPGTSILVTDQFNVHNQFHGGQLGYAMSRQRDRWNLRARASVALGVTHQELQISGAQLRTRPGQAPEAFTGGLLAAGPNLGTFENNKFSVVPEVTLNAGYNLTPNLAVHLGYNFIYWSNVIRPGDQIDRVVDLSFVPNAPPVPTITPRPQPTFTQSGFWTQGLQFGVDYRW